MLMLLFLLLKKKDLLSLSLPLLCVSVSVLGYVHMSAGAQGDQKADSLEPEVPVVTSHVTKVAGEQTHVLCTNSMHSIHGAGSTARTRP